MTTTTFPLGFSTSSGAKQHDSCRVRSVSSKRQLAGAYQLPKVRSGLCSPGFLRGEPVCSVTGLQDSELPPGNEIQNQTVFPALGVVQVT